MAHNRVYDIDLLRFLAALSVVIFHYAFRGYAADGLSLMPYPLLAPAAKYGYLGVQLFFLISGFVIVMSASAGGVKRFLISRAVRLYPAFWACCTTTFLLTFVIGGDGYSVSVGQYLVNLTMLSGFVGVASVDGVYWSLFVELKFYALVAVLCLCNKVDRIQRFLLLWLLAAIGLDEQQIWKFRSLLIVEYAPYFIGGALCFLIWARGLSFVRLAAVVTAWLLAVRHALKNLPALESDFHTEYDPRVVAGAITVFFAVLCLIATRRTGWIGRVHWTTLGALTYPLYLLHQNIGFMLFNSLYPAGIDPHLLLWGTVALMLAASYLVCEGVEQRLARQLKAVLKSLDRPRHYSLGAPPTRVVSMTTVYTDDQSITAMPVHASAASMEAGPQHALAQP
jgi:peptidoglycan/LPS O-acetylase OafA/YrhL